MSGIFSNIAAISYALQTQSKAVEQAGKNLSNLNNPNYARQRVIMGSDGTTLGPFGPQAGPPIVLGVEHVRDQFIDRQILNEVSYTASLETERSRLHQVLATLGETIDRINDPKFISDSMENSGSLRSQLEAFFNAFETLSASPGDPNARQVVYQAAENLVSGFNRLDDRLQQYEDSIVDEIERAVVDLNDRLRNLSDQSGEIANLEVGSGGQANDLRDTRLENLEGISGKILYEIEDLPEGRGLHAISVRDTSGNRVELVRGGEPARQIRFDATTGTFSVIGQQEELDLQVGELASLTRVRDTYLDGVKEDLDRLANTVATSVNELYYMAFQPAGVDPAVPEASFFQEPTPPPSVSGTPSTVTAGTIALYTGSTDPLVTESLPLSPENLQTGGGTTGVGNALALAVASLGTESHGELGGLRFSEFSIRTTISLGGEIRNLENRLAVQQDVESVLRERRSEVSGVSLDEEVTNMVQYQRAFQASSRVFNVLSEMLETIVNGLR